MTLFKILCIITKSQIIAAMAQEVERILGNDEVTGSTPVISSKNRTRLCTVFYFSLFIFHYSFFINAERISE